MGEDLRQIDHRQVDYRVFHDERRNDSGEDVFNELGSEIEDSEEKIAYYKKMIKEESAKKQKSEDRLTLFVKRKRKKSLTSRKFKAKITTSCYVYEVDKFLLPEEYRRYSFKVNKELIQKKCRKLNRPPEGVEFRERETIKVTRNR